MQDSGSLELAFPQPTCSPVQGVGEGPATHAPLRTQAAEVRGSRGVAVAVVVEAATSPAQRQVSGGVAQMDARCGVQNVAAQTGVATVL